LSDRGGKGLNNFKQKPFLFKITGQLSSSGGKSEMISWGQINVIRNQARRKGSSAVELSLNLNFKR